jgi:hypothetical protein
VVRKGEGEREERAKSGRFAGFSWVLAFRSQVPIATR